ncbi:hypothetical protein FLAG1_00470 [Fusarium langsethiae]|uniref:Uncharacterized protein n=1 Tax=Fusarium langsethiae TaxID=179993 RepID=A0A0N0DI94_FUSLA|nr:hypothetical protein FLAG1_00470 [Fusarium langsethiae]GKT98359.1 unnamed protein product [Fusarium langsethiae]GKU13178.1 unnamed protein product [Fusarium langsethiae]
MSRLPARQIGNVCYRCAFTPAPTIANQAFVSGALLATVRHSRKSAIRGTSTRWAATSSTYPDLNIQPADAEKVPRQLTDPTQLANIVESTKKKFLATDGIPAKQLTTAALETCLKAAQALQPQIHRASAQSRASTSKLMELGAERTGQRLNTMDAGLADSVKKISYSAYAIISQPNVEITPAFLELYVAIQSSLGRPESLPAVFEMYATKKKPVVKNGVVQYVASNPNAAVKAIEKDVADMALQTAIDSKHLDAALGIVEASFSLPAFKRQKLIKNATTPALALGTLPFGIFGLATAYATYWQNTMDVTTATGIGIAGISGYFMVVGSMGMIAKLSNKDQMKRVTWAPGTPLRTRWMREEERAAMDKIACAWGFKEPWRHGEESGPEWEGLKEYMGYRQMILDRVEFMEGMS